MNGQRMRKYILPGSAVVLHWKRRQYMQLLLETKVLKLIDKGLKSSIWAGGLIFSQRWFIAECSDQL